MVALSGLIKTTEEKKFYRLLFVIAPKMFFFLQFKRSYDFQFRKNPKNIVILWNFYKLKWF